MRLSSGLGVSRRTPDSVPSSSGCQDGPVTRRKHLISVLPAVLIHSAGYFCWRPAVHVVDQRGGQVSGVLPDERHGLWPDHNRHADSAGEGMLPICLPSL